LAILIIFIFTCRRLLREWANWKSWSEIFLSALSAICSCGIFFPSRGFYFNLLSNFLLPISSCNIRKLNEVLFPHFPHFAVCDIMSVCNSYLINQGNIHKRDSVHPFSKLVCLLFRVTEILAIFVNVFFKEHAFLKHIDIELKIQNFFEIFST
jgi:hypothetical protein